MKTYDEFTTAYFAAALWSSTDETNPEQGGQPLDENYDVTDIEPETLAEMVADCKRFQEETACQLVSANTTFDAQTPDARAGHDFWLTRNGHGAGFWDGDWTEPTATILTDNATAYGEYNLTASGKGGQVSKL